LTELQEMDRKPCGAENRFDRFTFNLWASDVDPPFNPLKYQRVEEASNFDKQFTSVELCSLTELQEMDRKPCGAESRFDRFTFNLWAFKDK